MVRPADIAPLVALILAAGACTDGSSDPKPTLTRAELLDPKTCESCHPDHYREWSGSMHAYAAEDPVFIAMNDRLQRETGGSQPELCIGCHAPVALREGLTTDGTNVAELPAWSKGVTCWFCHQVDAVEGTHNNPLRLADDGVMRGGIPDPVANEGHASVYSPLHDRNSRRSSDLCGSCHDVVTPAGAHIERTYQEWTLSVFGQDRPGQLNCGGCHMSGRDAVAADYEGVRQRRVHDHRFPGVDIALTPWPEMEDQRAAIQADLDPVLATRLCVEPGGAEAPGGVRVIVTLDNVNAGHMWPSGAGADRRAWVELVAEGAGGTLFESGVVSEGEAVAELEDPNLWLIHDEIFDENGDPTHMFWEAASFDSHLLPPAVTNDPRDPRFNHAVSRTYLMPGEVPEQITLRVHIRPMGLEILDDVIDSGDLDPEIRGRIPTFTLAGSVTEWRQAEHGFDCID